MSERVDTYADAFLRIAQSEGHLAEVEDELFRFARIVAGNDDLSMALSNRSLPVERRLGIVEELLEGKGLPTTVAIVSYLVAAGRGGDILAVAQRFVELAAASREHAVAEVRSAVPLDGDTITRIAESLSQATGKRVEVKVVVDETVLGGLVATIGDTVIDGTVRHRLDQLKEQM